MNETCWEEAIAALLGLIEETSPEVRELITPPLRLNPAASYTAISGGVGAGCDSAASSEITPASVHGSPGGPVGQLPPNGGSPSGSGGGAGTSNGNAVAGRSFTLREGVGARRLAKFRCQAATQLLLVQGCSEVYAKASQVGLETVCLSWLRGWLFSSRPVGVSGWVAD